MAHDEWCTGKHRVASRLVFSERELRVSFAVEKSSRSLYVVARPSVVCMPVVCRLSSVTLVHPTQAIEIFGNISTPFTTLAIC